MTATLLQRALVLGAAVSFVSGAIGTAPVYAVSKAIRDAALAACKKEYHKTPVSVQFSKDMKNITCVFGSGGGGKAMTRGEAYNWCRDKYHATAIIVNKTANGWMCRYYGP